MKQLKLNKIDTETEVEDKANESNPLSSDVFTDTRKNARLSLKTNVNTCSRYELFLLG